MADGRSDTRAARTPRAASRKPKAMRGQVAAADPVASIANVEQVLDQKTEQLRRAGLDIGASTGPAVYDAAIESHVRRHAAGALFFNPSVGAAFELHGTHLATWDASARRAELGFLATDVVEATGAGVRKSVFARGGLYSSVAGTFRVVGDIYLAYEAIGESKVLGAPKGEAKTIVGGKEQQFNAGAIFHQSGAPAAHEVHGAILAAYRAAGGPAKLGFPLSDEVSIRNGAAVVGRISQFERADVYWKAGVGAFVVAGDFRSMLVQLGGPTGQLGFPVANEVPLAGGRRAQRFEHGTMIWGGSFSAMTVVRPFRLFIGRINTDDEDPIGAGANDIYIHVKVKVGSRTVYDARVPGDGDWSTGTNIVDVNLQIPVDLHPLPKENVTLTVDVWDSDPGNDDHLGTWTHTLTAADGWGLATGNGLFTSASFSSINSITAAHQPVVPVNGLSATELFWGASNIGTDDISYQQYAAAFEGVDNAPDWWDVSDWLAKAFYGLVVRDIAENGNCFGMSLEAIYSRKGMSLHSQPLNRFKVFDTFRNEVNIKHCYQVGAEAIWWFVGQFLSGNTHDPVDVFNRSRAAFQRGEHPVLCLSQNYNFTGSPHCVLPVAWDASKRPWTISISDPNDPQAIRPLTVDPTSNSFVYQGTKHRYSGGAWTGGRLHYLPFSVVNRQPRTPIWDAILLLLAGTVVILGADAETTSLTDPAGKDLHGFGADALEELKAGRRLDGHFVPVNGFDADRTRQVLGEMLLRVGPRGATTPAPVVGGTAAGRLSRQREARTSAVPARQDFRHDTRALRGGSFSYLVKHGLSEFGVTSVLQADDTTAIDVTRLGTGRPTLGVRTGRDRLVDVRADHKLGVGRSRLVVKLTGLPSGAASSPLELQFTPGSAVEILPPARPVDAMVEVEATVDDKPVRRRFPVRVDGGTRLRLDHTAAMDVLRVERIDRLDGAALHAADVRSG